MPKSCEPLKLLTLTDDGPVQAGFWVPYRVWGTARYLLPLRKMIDEQKKAGTLPSLKPVIHNFKSWITANAPYHMWTSSMIEQANEFIKSQPASVREQIEHDGDATWIPSFDSLFEILNVIITTSPAFNTTEMVGTPMNGLLAVSMATEAGLTLFHDATFNAQFKKVLDAWNTFLKSSASLDKLDVKYPEKPGSWISQAAFCAGVWNQMQYHPAKPSYGFDSWNSFFLRQFVPGARPFQGDPATQICIGCETTPWAYEAEAELKTEFWIKDISYSLLDLFAGKPQWAKLFEGGQIYQGFLSAIHYHRWRAPITGNLVRSWVQPGTYFAQRPGQVEVLGTWEIKESQPYLGHVAARAIFIFEHAKCGYVAQICIGMTEVSTCVISPSTYIVDEGSLPVPIERDSEIGRFEFGGSTHMMLFQKDRVKLEDWAANAKPGIRTEPTKMGTVIATAI